MEEKEINILINIVQDSNLNVLAGSGLSVPFLSLLGNIESLLTELDKDITLNVQEKEIIRASILGKYFDEVIQKNSILLDDSIIDDDKKTVLKNYKDFLTTLNTIVLKRKSTLLNKQVNLFTTNIDIFFEKALEENQIEFNDGFYGRFNPVFSLNNFKKSLFKKSLHYDNTSEIPVFNLLKVHGSLTWKSEVDKVIYSELAEIKNIETKWSIAKAECIAFTPNQKLDELIKEVKSKNHNNNISDFLSCYDKLSIVNPTKEKFQDTILNLYYYEMLRVLSNELEKENTVLFIMGFSLADEHIREIIMRAANSNPTLIIIVFAFDNDAKKSIDDNIKSINTVLRYNNVKVFEPLAGKLYDFLTINVDVFKEILKNIGE